MDQNIYLEANPLVFGTEALYLVEGVLSDIEIAKTTVNLLEKIDNHVGAKSLVGGAAAVLNGMHGMVANSAAIALYDGEDTYNFVGLLSGRVICGSFQHADKIQAGNRVKAVVSKRDEVLFAHAIMNADTQEFYMPVNVFSSSDRLLRHCMRVAAWMTLAAWIVVFLVMYSVGGLSNFTTDPIPLVMLFGVVPLIAFPFEYWTYRSMRVGAKNGESYGGAIFRVFGFPRPEKIDLMRDSELSSGTDGGWYAAWRGDKLLQKNNGA
jgi:hypothetical protein